MRREVIKYNGITYRLDAKSFFYEPIPEDEHHPAAGLVILILAIACWAGVIAGAYYAYCGLTALFS